MGKNKKPTDDDLRQCVGHTDRPARNPDTDEFEEGTTRSADEPVGIEDLPDPASLIGIETKNGNGLGITPTKERPCRCPACLDSNSPAPDGLLIVGDGMSEDEIVKFLFGGCGDQSQPEDYERPKMARPETFDPLNRALAVLNNVSQSRFIEGLVFYVISQATIFGLQVITPICRETLKQEKRIEEIISRVSRSFGGKKISIECAPLTFNWELIYSLEDSWNLSANDFGAILSDDKGSILARFEEELLSRLKGLTVPEKKSFLEGFVFALKFIAERSLKLTPVSQERLSGFLLARAYNIIGDRKFSGRVFKRVRGDIHNLETVAGQAANVMFAKKLQQSMDIRLDHEESRFFQLRMAAINLMRKHASR